MGFGPEETMTFGDYLNDLEMLQVSEHSYAMENAHEAVKVARFSAPSNRDSGVMKVIKEKCFNRRLANLKHKKPRHLMSGLCLSKAQTGIS